jgi:hypothetical protein
VHLHPGLPAQPAGQRPLAQEPARQNREARTARTNTDGKDLMDRWDDAESGILRSLFVRAVLDVRVPTLLVRRLYPELSTN